MENIKNLSKNPDQPKLSSMRHVSYFIERTGKLRLLDTSRADVRSIINAWYYGDSLSGLNGSEKLIFTKSLKQIMILMIQTLEKETEFDIYRI